jgi:hypothetical protein
MAFVDTGYLYGARSIPRFIRREARAGHLRHKRMPPGTWWRKINRGAPNGGQINRYASEAERREALWRAKVAKRKERQRARFEREAAARRARDAERNKKAAAAVVRRPTEPKGPPPLPLASIETRQALAEILARLPRAAHLPEPPAPQPREPTWKERLEDSKRRLAAWGVTLGEKPDPKDD